MIENKRGLILFFILVLISGIVPFFINNNSIWFAFLLAIFGSALLSFIVCFINYYTIKRNLLKSIIYGTFYLEYTSKLLYEANGNNKLNKQQLISICSFVREKLNKEFDNIDLCVNGLFFWDKAGKKLLLDYREDLYDNVYSKYFDLYLFITTCKEIDMLEIKEELEKFLFKLAIYNEFLEKKEKINQHYFKGNSINSHYDNSEADAYISEFKNKLKNEFKEHEQ